MHRIGSSTQLLLLLFVSATAQIRILQPPLLAEKFSNGVIRGSTAAFGTPYWGERLVGKLSYNESKGDYYCSAEDYFLPPHEDTTEPADNIEDGRHFPRIVVVRRGGCHFAQKVKVAQDSRNASAVIIVDDEGSSRTPSDIRTIIMADDGLGSKIRIPSVLISDGEGSSLIDPIKTGQDVIVELMWDIPNDLICEVDHWISPGISTSINFLASFAPYARSLKHRINFKPHFFLFSLPSDANSMCFDATAKFCSITPDWQDSNATGQQIVHEILRESCLWFTTKSIDMKLPDQSGEYSEQWWNYIEKVGDRCLHPLQTSPFYNDRLTEKCSFDLMKELNIDSGKVKSCIEKAWETRLASDLYNHAWSPTAMMINEARFAGPLDAFVVARAICTGFTREPAECTALKSRHIHDVLFHDQPYILGESYAYHKGGVAWWVYFLSIFGAIILCIGMVLAYRAWLVKQLRNELRYEVFEEVKSQIGDIHKDSPPTTFSAIEIPSSRYSVNS